jgi:PAS domain S-box-containing protein
LIDLIPDPVIVVDGTRKIVAANNMAGKCFGYEGEQLIGKSALLCPDIMC